MRHLAIACMAAAILVAPSESGAQDYAIASLVGNQISYAYAYATIGTRIPEEVPAQPVAEPVFNEAALQAIAGVLRRADPQRKLVWLSISDAAIVETAKSAPSPGGAEFSAIVDPMAAVARSNGASRLIAVLPHRADLVIMTSHDNVGRGKGSGLGVYFDPGIRLRRSDTRQVGYGLLGLFANFLIVVVDTNSGGILATDAVTKGRSYSAARSPDADPFHALSPQQKVAGIIDLMRSGIEERLPAVLQRAPQ